MALGDYNWSDPKTYAETASKVGAALQSIAQGVGGFADVVAAKQGTAPTVQPQPAIAGPIAENPASNGPGVIQQWAAKWGLPVWAMVTFVILAPIIIIAAVWRIIRK